jgi:Kef-type K+ transport system membrane component KefB
MILLGLFVLLANLLQIPLTLTFFTIAMVIGQLIKPNLEMVDISQNLVGATMLLMLTAQISLTQINYPLLLVLILGFIPLKIFLTTGINVWFGFRMKESLESGLAQSQIGEVAFIVALIGASAGWLADQSLVNTLLAAVVLTTLASPFLYVNADWLYRLTESVARKIAPNSHRGLFINSKE